MKYSILLLLFICYPLVGMERIEPPKPRLSRQLSQTLIHKLKGHRRSHSEALFVNKEIQALEENPVDDAQQALLDGNDALFTASISKVTDPSLKAQLRLQRNAISRPRIQTDRFDASGHSDGSKIKYIESKQYKTDAP